METSENNAKMDERRSGQIERLQKFARTMIIRTLWSFPQTVSSIVLEKWKKSRKRTVYCVVTCRSCVLW